MAHREYSETPLDVTIEFTGELKELPKKSSENAAAYDIHADIIYTRKIRHLNTNVSERYRNEYLVVKPQTTVLILAGFKIQIPVGFKAEVLPRSGLALKEEVTIGNSPGTIDADYRGEVGIIIRNESKTKSFTISHGDRIAQMDIIQLPNVKLIEGKVDDTKRGSKGFGSTGK